MEDEVISNAFGGNLLCFLNGLLMGIQKTCKACCLEGKILSRMHFCKNPKRKRGEKNKVENWDRQEGDWRGRRRDCFEQRWLTKPYGAPNEQASSDESGHQGQKTIFHHYSPASMPYRRHANIAFSENILMH